MEKQRRIVKGDNRNLPLVELRLAEIQLTIVLAFVLDQFCESCEL